MRGGREGRKTRVHVWSVVAPRSEGREAETAGETRVDWPRKKRRCAEGGGGLGWGMGARRCEIVDGR